MTERRATYTAGRPTEHAEQVAVIQYCRLRGWLTFAIPNGAHLYGGFKSWRRLEAEGALKGVPDLFHPYTRKGYHGLFIEMKKGSNKPSPEQVVLLDALQAQGYLAVACWSASEAIDVLNEYMGEL